MEISENTADSGEQQQNNEVGNTERNEQQVIQRQPSRFESFFALLKSLLIRGIIIYFITSYFRRPQQTTNETQKYQSIKTAQQPAWNYFENGTNYDLFVYISDNFDSVNFNQTENLIWFQENLIYGDWYGGDNNDGSYMKYTKINASEKLMHNGTIYLHVFITKSGKTPNPNDGINYAGEMKAYTVKMLNKYKKLKAKRNYNLLSGDDKNIELKSDIQNDIIMSHWHPNLTINFVVDHTNWVKGAIPQPLDDYIHFVKNDKIYLPVVFINDYWNMLRDYQPINETTYELDLHLTFQPLGMFKWQLYAAQAMKNKWTSNVLGDIMSMGGNEENEEDLDSLKETLLETNPYLLVLTFVVSIIHSIFELLAFKNDIQFWNNRKSLEGLSVRSVFFGVFQSLIVLLYVLDNDTNFVIRLSCFIGLFIEFWKIPKVVDIKIDKTKKFLNIIPHINFNDKGSYVESSTKTYDNLAFKYLGWVCFPLLLIYSIYSLIYNEHKGWYSFILNMFYGFLLAFGFIMMTPQLFINYKLKSVAHLPWRMMTYKFLNTFIDDIFAFVIKMPTMYRLGCFRDDIVFFVFLYQRWIYKVDHKRINEYGFSGEMEINNKQLESIENKSIKLDKNQEQAQNTLENADEAKKDHKRINEYGFSDEMETNNKQLESIENKSIKLDKNQEQAQNTLEKSDEAKKDD